MNRRSFFTRLLGGAPVAAVAASTELTKVDDILKRGYDYSNYRGWKIRWTGWKPRSDGDYLVGQWLAQAPEGHVAIGLKQTPNRWWYAERAFQNVYSSYPGDCWAYSTGQSFDVGTREDQIPITATSDEGQRYLAQKKALGDLLDFIEKLHAEGLVKPATDIQIRT